MPGFRHGRVKAASIIANCHNQSCSICAAILDCFEADLFRPRMRFDVPQRLGKYPMHCGFVGMQPFQRNGIDVDRDICSGLRGKVGQCPFYVGRRLELVRRSQAGDRVTGPRKAAYRRFLGGRKSSRRTVRIRRQ